MIKVVFLLMLCVYVTHAHFSINSKIHYSGETHWQLFNECSQGMLQSFIGLLNTRGYPDRHCLTDWNVVKELNGIFRLQHVQSRKFLCFNKRTRITLRLNGLDAKCAFFEEIQDNGYSRIRSAWKADFHLGFNGRGRFQNPLSYHMKPRCFDWIKLVRYVTESEKDRCSNNNFLVSKARHQQSSILHSALRSNFLKKVSASNSSIYRP